MAKIKNDWDLVKAVNNATGGALDRAAARLDLQERCALNLFLALGGYPERILKTHICPCCDGLFHVSEMRRAERYKGPMVCRPCYDLNNPPKTVHGA